MENKNNSSYWDKRKKEGIKFLTKSKESRKVGRPLSFDSPEQLWEVACDYFKKCDGAPWLKKDFKGKESLEVEIPTSSPYLWEGLDDYCFELGICTSLKDYRTASRKPVEELGEKYLRYAEFSEVIRAIDSIMTGQKISGALVGAFNSNLVARLEGLAEKTEDVTPMANKRPSFVFIDKTKKE